MNIRKNRLKIVLGGIAVCMCMACGGSDTKDYWGDTSNGGKEEPTENPNASKPRYIWIDAAANFPDFANSKENIARDLALAKDAGFTDIVGKFSWGIFFNDLYLYSRNIDVSLFLEVTSLA